MKIEALPPFVMARLLQFEADARAASTRARVAAAAVANARRALTSNEPAVVNKAEIELPQLVEEHQAAETMHGHLVHVTDKCRSWLEQLPAVQLQQYTPSLPAATRADPAAALKVIREKLKQASATRGALQEIPVPAHDIKQRVQAYVQALAARGRPYVRGVAEGNALSVHWPPSLDSDRSSTVSWFTNNAHPLMLAALLTPDELVNAIMAEIEREANLPMPIKQREQRIAELNTEIDELQRQSADLVYALCQAGARHGFGDAPPAAILGVQVIADGEVRRVA